jgi:acyl-CoA thioester hydrolase
VTAHHETTVRVRYGETDRMGVVYHANYLQYFEIGRTEMMRAGGATYRALEEAGYALVVTQCGLEFKAAARYDDVLTIVTRAAQAGRVRIRFEYEVRRGQELLCEGFTVLACLKDGKVAELPEPVGRMIAEAVASRQEPGARSR